MVQQVDKGQQKPDQADQGLVGIQIQIVTPPPNNVEMLPRWQSLMEKEQRKVSSQPLQGQIDDSILRWHQKVSLTSFNIID